MTVLADAPAHVARVYGAVDRIDVDEFVGYLTEDGSIQFGNDEPMVGRAAIHEGISGFLGTLKGISHNVLESWAVDNAVFCDLLVTYYRTDGTEVTMPAATIWWMDGDLIAKYQIYIDMAPLFA